MKRKFYGDRAIMFFTIIVWLAIFAGWIK